MSEDSKMDRIAALCREHAHLVLAALIKSNTDPQKRIEVINDPQWRIIIHVEPAPKTDLMAEMTQCQRDIVEMLKTKTGFLSTNVILSEMDKLYHGTQHEWAESTIKQALADLVKSGVLGNRRRSPRGYFLKAFTPLFQDEPATDV